MRSDEGVSGIVSHVSDGTASASSALLGTADPANLAAIMRDATVLLERTLFLPEIPPPPIVGPAEFPSVEQRGGADVRIRTARDVLHLKGGVPAERPAMDFDEIRNHVRSERAERHADPKRSR